MTDDQPTPSRLSIVVSMIATMASIISTVYIGWGLWSMREVVGLVLGAVLTLLLFAQTLNRIVVREEMLRRARREARAAERLGKVYPAFQAAAEAQTQRIERYRDEDYPAGGWPAPGLKRH